MKVKLLLKIANMVEVDDLGKDDERLRIYVNFNDKRVKELFSLDVDSADKDDYLNKLEDAVNESTIYTAALGIKLSVDDSVYGFIQGCEEEIEKFVRRLVVEI